MGILGNSKTLAQCFTIWATLVLFIRICMETLRLLSFWLRTLLLPNIIGIKHILFQITSRVTRRKKFPIPNFSPINTKIILKIQAIWTKFREIIPETDSIFSQNTRIFESFAIFSNIQQDIATKPKLCCSKLRWNWIVPKQIALKHLQQFFSLIKLPS